MSRPGLTSRITPSTSAPNSSSLVPTITVWPFPFMPGRMSLTSQYEAGSGSPPTASHAGSRQEPTSEQDSSVTLFVEMWIAWIDSPWNGKERVGLAQEENEDGRERADRNRERSRS